MATTNDVSTVVVSPSMDYLPPPDPKAVEQAMLIGDISQMTDTQRISYYVATCRSLHLNPLTHPFMALKGDDGKMTLYPDKGCAEQLRRLHRVSMKVLSREFLDDLYIVTVLATTPDGRQEEAQGVVPISKPKGRWEDYDYRGQSRRRFKADVDSHGNEMTVPLSAAERATALMRAESKAKRRATLAICGLGMADWDAEPTSPAHPMALTLQTPPTEADKDLATHIADVFGDATDLQSVAATYAPRIEAVILAQPGGNVAHWDRWAERRWGKSRAQFTEADWQGYLAHVERLASENHAGGAQESAGATQAPEAVSGEAGAEDAPTGTQGPSWGPASPDLFRQEEQDATEYGE